MRPAGRRSILAEARTRDGLLVELWSDGSAEINAMHPLLAAGTDEGVGWLLVHHAHLFHSREADFLAGSARLAVELHDERGGRARDYFAQLTGRRIDQESR